MSRLHEAKTKGLDAVPSEPNWASIYPTMGDRAADLYLKAVDSPRKGMRTTRTKRKTAQASGRDFGDVRPWRVRNQGIASVKSKKIKDLKKAAKVAKETVKGDKKKA